MVVSAKGKIMNTLDAGTNGDSPESGTLQSNLDVLLDIELPVTLRFGSTRMALEAVIGLNTGSVVEFDRRVTEPVEVLVNGRVVARGEAVMVQGNYGVRISEIASRGDRLGTTSPDPEGASGGQQ
jgi:flagellar motor switch protein FliN